MGYEFILGARIKNEPQLIKKKILKLNLENGQSTTIKKEELKLLSPIRIMKPRRIVTLVTEV